MATSMAALLDGPSMAPPNGTISQLDNPPSQEAASHIIPALSIVIATASVAIRLYTRLFITRKFGLPDYSILVGYGAFLSFTVMCIYAVAIEPGVHMWDVRLRDLGPFLYYLRIASILYAPTIFLIKLSILSQYIQVFMPNKQPRFLYWTTISLVGANLVAYLVLLFMLIWSCTPMRKSWDPLVTGGHCLDTLSLNIGASTVNVVSDFAIFLLPQTVIWRLNMPIRQKMAVSTIFLIAILAIMAAAIRLYYTVQLAHSSDSTWYSWLTGVWALVEMDLGIIVACMPAAGAFVRSMSQSSLYTSVATSLKGLTTWRRMSSAQDASAYSMDERKNSHASQPTAQSKSWTKNYGVHGLDTLATIPDSDSARNLKSDYSYV